MAAALVSQILDTQPHPALTSWQGSHEQGAVPTSGSIPQHGPQPIPLLHSTQLPAHHHSTGAQPAAPSVSKFWYFH